MKRWVIADTHFGHENVIEYSGRPFSSARQMDEELIKNWNNTVSKNDTVYMLGDFSLSGSLGYIESIIVRLQGKIILVMGNHDRLKPQHYISCGFHAAIRKPILLEPRVILMHEPPLESDVLDGMNYIFGHIHEKVIDIESRDNCRCVSVERTNYKPIDLDKLLKQMKGNK